MLLDVLGWCSPAIIIPKMLLVRLWEQHLNWDELVSLSISMVGENWNMYTVESQNYINVCFTEVTFLWKLTLRGFKYMASVMLPRWPTLE